MKPIDQIIVVAYVALSAGSGVFFRGRQKSARDYFTAPGEMPGGLGTFLVGLSIAASLFSGVSFVAYPSTVYQNGPAILFTCLSFPFSWLVLRYWFLPRYFAQGGKTPFQILADRFGPSTRTVASIIFVLLRVSWMSTLLYAPTVALMAAAGLSQSYFWPFIATIGLICTFSATAGGLRGVVVTDALQFIMISVGLVCVIVTQFVGLTGSQIARGFADNSGLWAHPLRFDLNLTSTYSFWTLVIGFGANNLSNYMADQMTLQRYLSLGAARRASRSFGFNIFGITAVCLLLAIIGVLLRVWYAVHPSSGLPSNADKVLPFFIVQQLPSGVVGLLLAALLAATMNCMSSGINSLAGCVTNDFITPHFPEAKPEVLLRIGRALSVAIGLLSILGVLLIKNLGSIWEINNRLSGIFQGPLLGIMTMACLPEVCVPGWAVISGSLAGSVAGTLSIYWHVDSLWVTFLAFCATLVSSYALAWAGRYSRATLRLFRTSPNNFR